MRRDEETLHIVAITQLEVGLPAVFIIERLGDPETTNITSRVTTPVVTIEAR